MKKNTKIKKSQVSPAVGNALVAGLAKVSNTTLTENGALTNKSTLSHTLDFFGQGGALRTREESDINSLFSKAFAENRLAAMKTLFYLRDVRGGQGERKTFRTILRWLAVNQPEVLRKNLENVSFFGRWDDLYSLVGTPLENEIFKIIALQLTNDMVAMKKEESVSLLAKWLKSENTSSKESCRLGRLTRERLGFSPKKYRKTLSALRRYINVVEVSMCANQWDNIDFSKVTSKAALTYKKAFGKHNPTGFENFLKKVESGEVKINAGALYPYEILRSIIHENDNMSLRSLDLQWKSMPNWVGDEDNYFMVIADTSGSMAGLPILVSVSLALYLSERNVGPFKDCWINFSNNPTFQKVIGNTLKEKWENIDKENWDGSTNLISAFELILSTAKKFNVLQKDLPKNLIIISDMEFNIASDSNDKTNFEMIEEKYKENGYIIPKLIWWNVNSRNDNCPITKDDNGTCLVSGCSPSIFKSVLSGKEFNPVDVMLEIINKERYDRVMI